MSAVTKIDVDKIYSQALWFAEGRKYRNDALDWLDPRLFATSYRNAFVTWAEQDSEKKRWQGLKTFFNEYSTHTL